MDEVDQYHADMAERESRGEEPGFESFDEQASLHAYGDDSTEVTAQEAVTLVASQEEGGPEAAGLMAALMLHSAAEREALMPTWDQLWREKDEAFARGYAEGYAAAQDEIVGRLLGIARGGEQ